MSIQTPAPHSSAFTAAVLSMLIPGLGQAYQRRWHAALLFVSPLFLITALVAGIYVAEGLGGLAGALISPLGLSVAGIINILAGIWRATSAIDAWRGSLVRVGGIRPLISSLVGLALTVVVSSSLHLYLGGWIATASDLVGGIFSNPDGSTAPDPSGGTAHWDGKSRLNVLLVGIDQRGDSADFNTDTLIVASVDPIKGSVTMFSIPRDTVDFPVPPSAQGLYGDAYNNKINSYYAIARRHPDVFPDGPMPALRAMLSEFYDIPIDYSVMVNFKGFQKIVDTLDGVRIVTQNPVVDETYPASSGYQRRVRIQVGVHGMSGEEALTFARSRHGSSDFDRASRQQQVITAIRAQTDVESIRTNIVGLITSLKDALKSDFPQDDLPRLLELIGRIDTTNLRSLVFSPPNYQTVAMDERGYVTIPDVAKIRAAIQAAFAAEPSPEDLAKRAIDREGARVWVLNGTGRTGEAAAFTAALLRSGAPAIVPTGITSPEIGLLMTRFIVYNGAEARIPATLALLERLLGMEATRIDDPTVVVDVQIITGADLPTLP